MKHTFSGILFSFFALISFSQESYTPLLCTGEMPEDFTLSHAERLTKDQEHFDFSKSSNQYELTRFFDISNHYISQYLSEGYAVFGSSVNKYLTSVSDKILDANGLSNLKEELRYYVLKSTYSNSFVFYNGMIFISTGLLAQLENEAQLAFFISNKIAHYQLKHTTITYEDMSASMETVTKNLKEDNSYSYMTFDIDLLMNNFNDKVGNTSSFTRFYSNLFFKNKLFTEEELLDADTEAVKFMAKTGYDPKEAENALYALKYFDHPFDEMKWDKSFLNLDGLDIPEEKFKITEKPEVEEKKKKGKPFKLETHIDTRIAEIEKTLKSQKIKEGKSNFVSINEFNNSQKIARFENLKIQMLDSDYVKSIYECFLLKKKGINNLYIDECIAKSLYSLSKIKTAGKFKKYFEYYYKKDIHEGNTAELFNFLFNIENEELNIIALKHVSQSSSSSMGKFKRDLVFDLTDNLDFNYEILKGKLSDSAKKVQLDFKVLEDEEISRLSKIEKIRYSQKLKEYEEYNSEEELATSKSYLKGSFTNEFNNSEFADLFENLDEDNVHKSNIKKGSAKSYLFYEPYVYYSGKVSKSKSLTERLETVIGSVSTELSIHTDISKSRTFAKDEVNQYNEYCMFREWASEYSNFLNVNVLPLFNEDMEDYAKNSKNSYVYLVSTNFVEFATKYKHTIVDISNSEEVYSKIYQLISKPKVIQLKRQLKSAFEEMNQD